MLRGMDFENGQHARAQRGTTFAATERTREREKRKRNFIFKSLKLDFKKVDEKQMQNVGRRGEEIGRERWRKDGKKKETGSYYV